MNNVLEFRPKCAHDESLSDCREALEPAVMKIVSDAIGKGYTAAEAAMVVADIADDYILMLSRQLQH
ncbi:hypothetical protein BAE36_28850 [Rhizobium leguminosarum bv. trifolii]|jgi:hypothetical protein|uniref:Uncharacterized protein n=1 Tax=Rhizobium leguminosarum bv. trifolii TaxID=386 RepID=A0A1B8R4M8_RHILT|nr:hypothetical protein [Rhizobium leguminosarum]MDH6659204.1 hypothetical protein [Rhizobium sophorae]AOO93411.1 hypothetical protein [Rhizobium leguminosarum bv. trifolii]MBA8835727.1 hypothetical protein [Rhizobium leguminosarum]MBB4522961.1 hypothetical protein [Rhizobium leguminosarum]MBP2486437.1 hypothetical protein [Rhizobium leguminosarum]